ncbi:MAG: hypothetical protein ABR562_08015 [Thermoplasmatota archaeon]
MGLVVHAAVEAFLDSLDPFAPAYYAGRRNAAWHLEDACRFLMQSLGTRMANKDHHFAGIRRSRVAAMRASGRHPCMTCVQPPKSKRKRSPPSQASRTDRKALTMAQLRQIRNRDSRAGAGA